MQDILKAIRLLANDVASLQVATKAAAVAAVVAPIVAAVLGLNITAAELAGYLVIAGTVVATLERVFHVKAAKPAPKPVVPGHKPY